MTMGERLASVAKEIGAVLPAGAVRLGWNAKDLRWSMQPDEHSGDVYELWSVEIVGPIRVGVVSARTISERTPNYLPVFNGGTLGTFLATTPEQLIEDVRFWVQEMHLADLRA